MKLAAPLALCLSACTSDLSIPSDAQIDCSSSACPSGWTCTAAKRCVPSDAIDLSPPALSGAAVVTPAVARAGVNPTVTFTVSEALSERPVVRVNAGTVRQLTHVSGESPGLVYTYAYARAGDEPQGADCPVTVDLTDTQGVASTGLAAGALRFDDVAPAAIAPAIIGSPARAGGTVRVTFTASEPLASDPSVRAGAALAFTKDPASSGRDYVYVRTSDGTEPQGTVPVTATLTDAAGNSAEAALGTVAFDRSAPGLLAAPEVAPPAAAAGTLVRVGFTADEDLRADPVVKLGALALEKGAQVGRTYTYSRVAAASDGDGDRPLSIELVDLAGNDSGALAGPSVRFDFTAPTVNDLSVCDDDGTTAPCAADQRTFSAQAGHDRVKIGFTLSEPPGPGPDGLSVEVGGVRLGTSGPDACRNTSGLAWICTATVVDPQPANPRIDSATVAVAAVDAAGNAGTLLTFLTYDFRPPGLAGTPYFERCDAYPPARLGPNDLWVKPVASFSGAGCPLTICGLTGPIRVQFSLDEAVALGPGGVRLDDGTPLTVAACASSPTQIVALLAADATAGNRTVTADLRDATGNARSLALGTLRVDRTAPAAPDTLTTDRITYLRYPWGADATGGAKAFFLRGAAGAVAAGSTVVAYDGPNPATAALIGRTTADAGGAFGAAPGASGAFDVASGDVPEIFVTQEDAAGNRSPAALVWDGQWTATSGFKQAGSTAVNPNLFSEEPAWRDSRWTAAQREPPDPTAAASVSGAGVTTTGEPDLRFVSSRDPLPPKRGSCAMAYDPDLGRAILFGGFYTIYAVGPFWASDTWEWDGGSWREIETPVEPPGREGHGLAYDQARRRLVLFGGTSGSAQGGWYGDTWELDGSTWRRVCWPGCTAGQCTCGAMPSPRSGAATFYDPVSGHTLVAGGTDATGARNDTWSWDGRTWTQLTPATSPPAFSGASVAVSPELGQTMILPPSGGTWFWDGFTWTGFADGGSAEAWWDPGDRKFHRFMTNGRLMWTWNGATWDFLGPDFPSIGDVSGLTLGPGCSAFDRERGGYVRFGGCLDSSCRQDYSSNQVTGFFTWQAIRQLAPGVGPVERVGAAMADFPPESGVWLYGGRNANRYAYADNWIWDGATWRTDGLGSAFEGTYSATLAYLGGGHLFRLWGASSGGGSPFGPPISTYHHEAPGFGWAIWSGDFTYYSEVPARGMDQSAAFDEVAGRALFFRGNVGGQTTWTVRWADYWDPWFMHGETAGVLWEPVTTTTTPSSVSGHRMAWCPDAGGTVLFGGQTGAGTYLDETWVWSGTDWVLRLPAQKPPARAGHAMFCDRNRGKLYVVGGQDASGDRDDVWEWDGTTWRERSPAEKPLPRNGMGASWFSTNGTAVLFGGSGNGFQDDTWIWDGGRDRRPAQILHARFGAAGAADGAPKSVAATFWTGATAYAAPGPIDGVQLHVRDRGLWRPVANASTAPLGTPARLGWSTLTDPEWTAPGAPARLRRLFSGDTLDLSVAVAPRGTNLDRSPGARIATRYAEVEVRYRLACLPAGRATTNALRCCSGTAGGSVCQ